MNEVGVIPKVTIKTAFGHIESEFIDLKLLAVNLSEKIEMLGDHVSLLIKNQVIMYDYIKNEKNDSI